MRLIGSLSTYELILLLETCSEAVVVPLVPHRGLTPLDDHCSEQGEFRTYEVIVGFQKVFKQIDKDWKIG